MAASISDFETIRVKFDKNTEAYHVMYLKCHSVREKDKRTPNGRTLFVLNVPPYCLKTGLRNVFGGCGVIENIFIQKQPGPVVEYKKSFFNVQGKLEVSL
jgi:ribosomal RNA-processing protein 7